MAYTTFKSKYVLHTFPDFSEEPSPGMYMPMSRFSGLGVSVKVQIVDYHVQQLAFKYSFITRAGIGDFNSLFDYCMGRRGTLWVPSWNKDITLTANIGASDTTIQIRNISYSTYFPATPGTGRYLFFYRSASAWYARKVTATPSATSLTLESSLGTALTMANTKMVCFLYLVRFDIDEMEWKFIAPNVAETTVNFVEVPKEYASLT